MVGNYNQFYMPKRLFYTFLFFSSTLLSQTRLTVMDGFMEDQPLEGVSVVDDENRVLGKTNSKGVFVVPATVNRVSLNYEGYAQKKLYVYGKDLVVKLHPITVLLHSSEISNDDSEARNLIKQVIQNQKKNSIENLKSYQFKSYSKFLVTASTDSMPYIMMPRNEKDSAYNDIRKLLDKSHLMLGERAMDHKYSSQYGRKNVVKATRISGTKLPMYEFAAMQPISHSFEDEKINFFFRQFINPVSQSGLKEYRYRISEKDTIDNRPMLVISYFPQKRIPNNQQIKGKVWIDQERKAIAKFYGENLSDTHVAELEVDWTNVQNYWFPKHQRFRMDGGAITYPATKDTILPDGTLRLDTIRKKEKVWLHLTTSFKDIITPEEFDRKEFKGYENEVDVDSMENPESTLEAYRDNRLTEMEKNTYVKIDSIGEKYKMDRNIQLLRVISSGGKLAIGKYDLDLTKIFNYNDYEGFRLGLGGNTNYKFHDRLSLNGYVAYGFQDEKFKFGGGIEYLVNKPYSGKLFASYAQDVEASGRNPIILQNNYISFIQSNFSNLYYDDYFSYRKVQVGYEQDFWQNFTVRLSGIYSEKEAEFEYQYQNNRMDEKFLAFDTQLALRWAPKDKNVRTPFGKVTISSGLPVFYLALTQGINLFNADYTPTRLDFSYLDLYRTFLGQTDFQFRTGISFGDTPIMNLYEGMGNSRNREKILERFGVAGINTFETMVPGEFYSDRFLMVNVSHKFAGFMLMKREVFPEFIYRGLIGDIHHPEDHHFIDFKTPNKYYQEGGLELNQLIYGLVGIGAYYRFGAYAYDNFDQNFFVKATLKLTFF